MLSVLLKMEILNIRYVLFHNLFLIHYSCFQWQYSIFRSCPVLSFDGKESACSVRDLGSIPRLGRSPGGGMAHSNILALEKPHGQRSLAGYSQWGHKLSDTTERLSMVQFFMDVIWLIALTPYLLTDSGVPSFYLLLSTLTFFPDIMTGQWLSPYIYFSILVNWFFKKKFFLIEIC